MSNWPINCASRSESLGYGTGDGTGTTAGNGSKGSYVTLGTTTFRWDCLLLSLVCGSGTLRFRVDIAINTGGSDLVIVEDLFVDFSGSVSDPEFFFLPVRIPSGATIKTRTLSTATTANSLYAAVTGFAKDFMSDPSSQLIKSCTDFTSALPTNTVVQTGQTWTAWTTVRATTPNRFKELIVGITGAGDTTRTATNFIVQIGVGAAGSEKVIGQILCKQATSALFGSYGKILADIPSGSRVSFRTQCANNSAADTVGVAAIGVVA